MLVTDLRENLSTLVNYVGALIRQYRPACLILYHPYNHTLTSKITNSASIEALPIHSLVDLLRRFHVGAMSVNLAVVSLQKNTGLKGSKLTAKKDLYEALHGFQPPWHIIKGQSKKSRIIDFALMIDASLIFAICKPHNIWQLLFNHHTIEELAVCAVT